MNSVVRKGSLILLTVSASFQLSGCKKDDEYSRKSGEENKLSGSQSAQYTHAISFTIGDSGYVCPAYSAGNSDHIKGFWAYNTQTKMWSQAASFPGSNHKDKTAFVAKGKAYIVDGKGVCGVWEYDPRTNIWTK